jgi:hypothetical protein
MECSVRQGDVLAPSIFCLFINDLIDDISILVVADDIVLTAVSMDELQLMVNRLKRWCEQWKMTVNKDKTKLRHFRLPSISRTSDKCFYGTSELDFVSSYRYMNISLTRKSGLLSHCKYISNCGQ